MGELQFQQLHLWGFLNGTDVTDRSFFRSFLLIYICFLSTLCRGSNLFEILEDCDTNFLSVLLVMNIIMYFFWGIVIIQSYFVYFLSLNLQMLYLFKELIQRVSSFHSFIMILISFWCYLWSSVVWEQRAWTQLQQSCISEWVCCWVKDPSKCLFILIRLQVLLEGFLYKYESSDEHWCLFVRQIDRSYTWIYE